MTGSTPPLSLDREPVTGVALDLAGLEERALLAIIGSLPRSSRRRMAACEVLVDRYQPLVRFCARRYQGGPELAEDLMQVGYVALIKAIGNYDPARGHGLASYAQVCITGEIKRHFRDGRWQLHVARSVKELALNVRAATWQLAQELGRTPSDADLAGCLGVSDQELRDARLAEVAFRPSSLDAPLSGETGAATLGDLLGEEDPRLEHVLGMQAVAAHWGELPRREQEILRMRFRGDMTQAQIGEQIGLSQIQVSRLISHALGHLRLRLFGLDERAAAAPQAPARLRHPRALKGTWGRAACHPGVPGVPCCVPGGRGAWTLRCQIRLL